MSADAVMSCAYTTGTMAGRALIQATGDGDMGPGVSEVRGTLELNISVPPATEFEMSATPPVDAPAPTP